MSADIQAVQKDRFALFTSAVFADLVNLRRNEFVSYAIGRQLNRVRKKFRTPERHVELTIAKFHYANKLASEVKIDHDIFDEYVGDMRDFIFTALERATRALEPDCAPQQCFSLPAMFSLWKFGPGASNGVKGSHFCQKIIQAWTVTDRAIPYVRIMRRLNPLLNAQDNRDNSERLAVVRGSRQDVVPKNDEIGRDIGIEPLGNMAAQLALGKYIEEALRQVGIRISASAIIRGVLSFDRPTQADKQQKLAMLGSIDGKTSTLDLEMASHLITFLLIDATWPQEWCHYFRIFRSDEICINDEYHKLHMVSTMGNGFTFPMMTLTLAALIYAVGRVHSARSRHCRLSEGYGVFGDDIIVPTDMYAHTTRLLEAVGLRVNSDKSYSQGNFRESCGGDFYKGYDVTPFYAKSLQTDTDVNVVINQVLDWSSKHHVYMEHTLTFLNSILTRKFLVPEWEDATSGIRTTLAPARKYHCFSVKTKKKRCKGPSDLVMLMVLGGYASGVKKLPLADVGTRASYTPRPFKVVYKVRKKLNPSGFRGRCVLTYTASQSSWRDLMVTLLLS